MICIYFIKLAGVITERVWVSKELWCCISVGITIKFGFVN